MDKRGLQSSKSVSLSLVKIILLLKLKHDKRVHQQTQSSGGDQTMGWTFPGSTEHRPFLLQHKGNSSPAASDWNKPPRSNSKDLSTDTLGKGTEPGESQEDQPRACLPVTFHPMFISWFVLTPHRRGTAVAAQGTWAEV